MMILVSLLRGVNLGGHRLLKMDQLRALYSELGLRDAQTYLQSGNVIFRAPETDLSELATRIEDAIETRFGFRSAAVVRTVAEWRDAIARNPFPMVQADGSGALDPSKLLVYFLAGEPARSIREEVLAMATGPESVEMSGRELYIYFPEGQGRSRFPWAKIDRMLQTQGTGRNWRSVMQIKAVMERCASAGESFAEGASATAQRPGRGRT